MKLSGAPKDNRGNQLSVDRPSSWLTGFLHAGRTRFAMSGFVRAYIAATRYVFDWLECRLLVEECACVCSTIRMRYNAFQRCARGLCSFIYEVEHRNGTRSRRKIKKWKTIHVPRAFIFERVCGVRVGIGLGCRDRVLSRTKKWFMPSFNDKKRNCAGIFHLFFV